jgi:integration host factor subunit beta
MRTITGSDLVARIAYRFPDLMAKDPATALKAILHAIGDALSQGERVEIRGFGSFGLNYRPARTRAYSEKG